MPRPLAVCIAISAGAHAALIFGLPTGTLGLPGLGLGGASPRADRLRMRFVVLETPARPDRLDPTVETPPELPVTATPAGTFPVADDADDVRLGPAPLAVEIALGPRLPAERPPAPQPARGTLPLPPPIPRPEAGPPVRVEDIRWNRRVGDRIGPQIRLPKNLDAENLHGSVRLILYLTPEGRIRDLRVADPGPYPALTLAAQAQVRASAPFPPAPPGMDSRLLRIPVNLHY